MSIELKVKSKHLSEEARIIRFEENKMLKQVKSDREYFYRSGANGDFPFWDSTPYRSYESLASHRKVNVRNENRATFLARTYLAGKPYSYAENTRKPEKEAIFNYSVVPRVVAMVNRYKTKEQPIVGMHDIYKWVKQ